MGPEEVFQNTHVGNNNTFVQDIYLYRGKALTAGARRELALYGGNMTWG